MSAGKRPRDGDPRPSDLPGLFPAHDGSYGVNTLINVEPSSRRGKKSRTSGIANEEEEDQLFRRRLLGKDGRRFNTRATVEEVLSRTVEEAEKPPEKPVEPAPVTETATSELFKGTTAPLTDSLSGATRPLAATIKPPEIHPLYRPADPNVTPQVPRVPRYDENLIPITSTATRKNTQTLKIGRLGLRSENTVIANRHPDISPFDPLPPSYGMPTGRGSALLWSSPSRPDSSRSFNAEGGLYGDANLQTPIRDRNARDVRTGLTEEQAMTYRLTGRLPEQPAVRPPLRPDPTVKTVPLPRFKDPNAFDAIDNDGNNSDPGTTPARRSSRRPPPSSQPAPQPQPLLTSPKKPPLLPQKPRQTTPQKPLQTAPQKPPQPAPQRPSQPAPQVPQSTSQVPQPGPQVPKSVPQAPPIASVPPLLPEQDSSVHQASPPQTPKPRPQVPQPGPQVPRPAPQKPPQTAPQKPPQTAPQVPQTAPQVYQASPPQAQLQVPKPAPQVRQVSQKPPQPAPQVAQPAPQVYQTSPPQAQVQVPKPAPQVRQTTQQVPQPTPQVVAQPTSQVYAASPPQAQLQVPKQAPQARQVSQKPPQPAPQVAQPTSQVYAASPPQAQLQVPKPAPIRQVSQKPPQPAPQVAQPAPQIYQTSPPQAQVQVPKPAPVRQVSQKPPKLAPQAAQPAPQVPQPTSQVYAASPPQAQLQVPKPAPVRQVSQKPPKLAPQAAQPAPQVPQPTSQVYAASPPQAYLQVPKPAPQSPQVAQQPPQPGPQALRTPSLPYVPPLVPQPDSSVHQASPPQSPLPRPKTIPPANPPPTNPRAPSNTGSGTPSSQRSRSSYNYSDHGSPAGNQRGNAPSQVPPVGNGGGSPPRPPGGNGPSRSPSRSSSSSSSRNSQRSTTPTPPAGLTPEEAKRVTNLVQGMRRQSPSGRRFLRAPPLTTLAGLTLREIDATRKMVLSMTASDPADVKRITDALDQAAALLIANANQGPPVASNAPPLSRGTPPPVSSTGLPPLAGGTPPPISGVGLPPVAGGTPPPGSRPAPLKGLTANETRLVGNLVAGMRLPPLPAGTVAPVPSPASLAGMTLAEINAARSLVTTMNTNATSRQNIIQALDQAARNLAANAPQPAAVGPLPRTPVTGTPNLPPPPPPSVVPPRTRNSPPGSGWPWSQLNPAMCYDIFKSIVGFLFLIMVLMFFFRAIKSANSVDIDGPNLPGVEWQGGLTTVKDYTVNPIANIWSKLTNVSSTRGKGGVLGPKGSSITDDQLHSVRGKLPGTIVVEKDKDGKLIISQDFWHALKDLIKADDIILTLENAPSGRDGKFQISEEHWRAIKARLEQLGQLPVVGTGDPTECCGVTGDEVQDMIDKSLSRPWGQWLEQNEDNLKKTITGVAVSRDEFMDLLRKEVKSYQSQIKEELEGMDTRINKLVAEITKLQKSTASLSGTSKKEIKDLVNATVKKVVDHAVLDAMANGQIKGHANKVLFDQVNFFGIGAGAITEPDYTSRIWTPPKNIHGSKAFLDRDGKKPNTASAALRSWTEEGECFCAGSNMRGVGAGTATLSVLTARNFVPQHLVVEHILPGATLDPGAMPREIEVWAGFADVRLRKEVEIFSKEAFPNTPPELTLDEDYVKIGHFVYENKTYGDGVQVFKISDQLVDMNAFTDHIVVRAINNYGADHTCFYQVKMYGEIVEREEDPNNPYVKSGWFA